MSLISICIVSLVAIAGAMRLGSQLDPEVQARLTRPVAMSIESIRSDVDRGVERAVRIWGDF